MKSRKEADTEWTDSFGKALSVGEDVAYARDIGGIPGLFSGTIEEIDEYCVRISFNVWAGGEELVFRKDFFAEDFADRRIICLAKI